MFLLNTTLRSFFLAHSCLREKGSFCHSFLALYRRVVSDPRNSSFLSRQPEKSELFSWLTITKTVAAVAAARATSKVVNEAIPAGQLQSSYACWKGKVGSFVLYYNSLPLSLLLLLLLLPGPSDPSDAVKHGNANLVTLYLFLPAFFVPLL